ncbi:MAG: ModD protein [Bacteroidales bacterium]|nr:ModD protein [Bacteroidales bacterium]
MIYFTDQEIDQLITEDVQYVDLTTSLLRLENKPARMQISTREPAVVCCTEEVMKIFTRTGIQTTLFTPSGEYLEKDVKFLEGEGLSGTLLAISRTIDNILRYTSGVATRTRLLVEKAREVNKNVIIATTRKTIPNTRKMAIKAVKAGGAAIHRYGLSETILVHRDQYRLLGGLDKLAARLSERMAQTGGKSITVEVDTVEDALKIAESGIDVIQLDKFSITDIKKLSRELSKAGRKVKLAAAGNISIKNIQDYAASGADIIVTSWPYNGEPADMKISIQPIYDLY